MNLAVDQPRLDQEIEELAGAPVYAKSAAADVALQGFVGADPKDEGAR